MRYIIIGDIHGCYLEASELISKLNPSFDDQVISIGDIIHKGPSESKTLSLIQSHSNIYVLGNHEEKQIRWQSHEERRIETNKPNPMKNVENYNLISPFELDWLKSSARLFVQIEVIGNKFLLVHGGIEPSLRSLPSTNIVSEIPKKEKYRAMNLLRTRYVNSEGNMISLGDEKPGDKFWAEVYDGRFGHVIFGHQPFVGSVPMKYENATGIDLGCVYGGYLCAAVIDKTGAVTYHTSKAKDKYRENRFGAI